jgi:hypothetical protein
MLWAASCRRLPMSVLAVILSICAGVYLVAAIAKPEWFT